MSILALSIYDIEGIVVFSDTTAVTIIVTTLFFFLTEWQKRCDSILE